MKKCIDCAYMIKASGPYTEDFCQKFQTPRSRHAVGYCSESSPVPLFRSKNHPDTKGSGFCKGENEVQTKKPIPTEFFTVTKKGDANTSEHYKHFRIQPIDFIVANDLGFLESNVIKYICRYPYKGSALKDLEKARQYVDWLIERERKRGSV